MNTVTTLVSDTVKPRISTGYLLVFTGGAYKGGYGSGFLCVGLTVKSVTVCPQKI